MKLLMHLCCAPCAVHPLRTVRERGIGVTGFWFNPNIHPVTEYRSRLDSLKKLQALWNLDIAYRDEYGLKEYLRAVAGDEENRCVYCYTVRLEETARTARELGADAFTTSLLVSPYQKFDTIVQAGKTMQERYSVEFFAEDFRGGFREGRKLAGEMGLYRQKYCGCVYSEMERHLGGNR
ncbi:MAG: epoxyqueuosine reductase QueH [Thermodesulfovibrionales bacterium]